MVLTLFEIASLSIRNGIIDGEIDCVDYLPKAMRQRVFDMMKIHQMLDSENCIKCFRQPGFLDGLNRIDMLPTTESDIYRYMQYRMFDQAKFLVFLGEHFGSNPNLADQIHELKLVLPRFVDGTVSYFDKEAEMERSRFAWQRVYRLLSLCGNLKNLHIVCIDGFCDTSRRDSIFDRLSHAIDSSGSSGLHELTLVNMGCSCDLLIDQSKLFGSLIVLRLIYVQFHTDTWQSILRTCRRSLKILYFERVYEFTDGSASMFPIDLPELTSVTVDKITEMQELALIADRCPRLIDLHLRFDADRISTNDLPFFAALPQRYQLSVAVCGQSNTLSDLISLIGKHIVKVEPIDHKTFIGGIHRSILTGCPNLTSLDVDVRSFNGDTLDQFLRSFFSDRDRSIKLRNLCLNCYMSYETMALLFQNCIKLEGLELYLDHVSDDESIDDLLLKWVDNGARPSRISLRFGKQINNDTLRSILMICGRDLKDFTVATAAPLADALLLRTVFNCCPNIELFMIPNCWKDEDVNRFTRRMFYRAIDHNLMYQNPTLLQKHSIGLS